MNAPRHLPAHARVIANDAVWMEGAAIDQLTRVACLPGCRCAVGMPDLHPGRGIPIGAAFAFEGVLHPSLVGGDAGCGARWTVVPRTRFRGDLLLRRIEEATEQPVLPDCDPDALLTAAWTHGPRALAELDGVPDGLAAWLRAMPTDTLPASGPLPAGADRTTAGEQLGTAGGGNHFLELSRVDQLADREAARNLGLSRDALVVLAHSGSRGLGGALHEAWAGGELTDPTDQAAYLAQLAGACRYATANRALLTWRLLTALGATSTARIGQSHDVLHNTVLPTTWRGTPVWLHRKGAAPAEAGQPTVVLGSRGAPSWILLGSGNEDALWSAAHGAGRKLGRAEAVDKLKHRHHRSTLRQTRLGGRVICDDDRLLLAEHPDAYKDVQPVVDSLIEHGVAAKVAALVPLVTVKR